MKVYILFISMLVVYSCVTPVPYSAPWQSVFSEDEKNWSFSGDANWIHEDGVLKAILGEGAGFIVSNARYRDFHLKIEFMPDAEVNSGVFTHCQKGIYTANDCYEFNIWDLHENPDFSTGAIVTRAKPLAKVETVGKWNKYEIKVKNNHLQAWINGIKTADFSDSRLDDGYIALQMARGGDIKFRNMILKRL